MCEFPLLHDPENMQDPNTWFCNIPILGDGIGYWRQCNNELRLVNQAVERGPVPEEAWEKYTYNKAIRKEIEQIVIERAFPAKSQFHPEDPIELMMVLRYGDLNEWEIMMRIDDRYGIKFTDDLIDWLIDSQVTFIEFIKYIEKHAIK